MISLALFSGIAQFRSTSLSLLLLMKWFNSDTFSRNKLMSSDRRYALHLVVLALVVTFSDISLWRLRMVRLHHLRNEGKLLGTVAVILVFLQHH